MHCNKARLDSGRNIAGMIAEETSLECKISIPQIARRMVDNVKRKATDLEL